MLSSEGGISLADCRAMTIFERRTYLFALREFNQAQRDAMERERSLSGS